MKDRSLFIGVAALVCAAVIFSGCESPTDGSSGAAGASGTIYLAGSLPSAAIQSAIDSRSAVGVRGRCPGGRRSRYTGR
jgi:hypothetical protein